MFNLTIKENLLLGNPKSSEEELWKACKKAYIYDFIDSLPKGFDTIIGERGIKLSGGQKQRLAIARTLLSNTEVIVFDEATSALDYESEKVIHRTIKELCSEKTIIIIAHRLSSILLADKVIVMDKGEVVGTGNNNELLGNNKVYDKLFKAQYNATLVSQ
jgi:ABC-type multidrug transport system fused ATPase/permease subunit